MVENHILYRTHFIRKNEKSIGKKNTPRTNILVNGYLLLKLEVVILVKKFSIQQKFTVFPED
jgi:hypothetical protein